MICVGGIRENVTYKYIIIIKKIQRRAFLALMSSWILLHTQIFLWSVPQNAPA